MTSAVQDLLTILDLEPLEETCSAAVRRKSAGSGFLADK